MKSVDSKKYNKDYYNIFNQPNYSKYHFNLAPKKFHEVSQLVNIDKNKIIIDYGCGQGDMCFYLSSKYDCKIIGIDYSSDAIFLAKKHLKDFNKNRKNKANIEFFNLDNKSLPDYKNIDYIFLNDVVEHLYNEELKLIFNKFKKWNKNITIIIHTDNDLYLKLVRPLLDIFTKIFNIYEKNHYISRKEIEKLHVNLTYPLKFKSFMKTLGFKEIKLVYPQISKTAIEQQLGGKKTIMTNIFYSILILLKHLSPSFYSSYKRIK